MEAFVTKIFVAVHFITRYTSGSAFLVEVQNYSTGITWFDAFKRCGDRGLEHDLSILSNVAEFQDNKFWIGKIMYNELTPWIEHLGCYRSKQSINGPRLISRNKSVGICQQNCQSYPYFGYQRITKECQCINDVTFVLRVNMMDCFEHPGNNTMVYTQFNATFPCDEKHKCMVSKCNQGQSHNFPEACEGTGRQGICENDFRPFWFWNRNYTTALQNCYNNNKTLAHPTYCNHENRQPVWTRIFCENITVEHLKVKSGNATPVTCLSGIRENIEISPTTNVEERPCMDKLKLFACKSSKHSVTSNHPTLDQYRPSTAKAFTKYEDPQTTSITFSSSDQNGNSVKSSSNTGALVGGIVVGVILIVVVTVLVWLLRNRAKQAASHKEIQPNCSQKINTVNNITNIQYGLEIQFSQNADADNGSKLSTKETPEYAVVQKQNKVELSEDTCTYAVASEEEYDKLNNVMSRKPRTEPNVYSLAGQCGEGEYDTMKGMSSLNANRLNNLYDTNCSF